MNSISKFHSEPFIDALKAFFEELKVPVDYLADEPASANDILGERYKATNEAHKLITDVYALGMVNDAIFEGTETFKNLAQVKKLKTDYANAPITEAERVMCDYVVQLTKDAVKIHPGWHEKLRNVGFDDQAILQITLIASWFNYINRVADALGIGRE